MGRQWSLGRRDRLPSLHHTAVAASPFPWPVSARHTRPGLKSLFSVLRSPLWSLARLKSVTKLTPSGLVVPPP